MGLDFNKIVDEIDNYESVSALQTYNNISLRYPKVVACSGSREYLLRQYGVTANDTKLSAIEKWRAYIIEDYTKKGYKIYQIDFTPDAEGREDDDRNPLQVYRRSKLSELWVPRYKRGEFKQRVMNLIEEEERRNKEQSKSSSSSGKSSKTTLDNYCGSTGAAFMSNQIVEAYNRYSAMSLKDAGLRNSILEKSRRHLFLCPYDSKVLAIRDAINQQSADQAATVLAFAKEIGKLELEGAYSHSEKPDVLQISTVSLKMLMGPKAVRFGFWLGGVWTQLPDFELTYERKAQNGSRVDVQDTISFLPLGQMQLGCSVQGEINLYKASDSDEQLNIVIEGGGFMGLVGSSDTENKFASAILKEDFADIKMFAKGSLGLEIISDIGLGVGVGAGLTHAFLQKEYSPYIDGDHSSVRGRPLGKPYSISYSLKLVIKI